MQCTCHPLSIVNAKPSLSWATVTLVSDRVSKGGLLAKTDTVRYTVQEALQDYLKWVGSLQNEVGAWGRLLPDIQYQLHALPSEWLELTDLSVISLTFSSLSQKQHGS